MGLKTMARMDALTRHAETNGNTPISLKIKEGVAAHSTLLASATKQKRGANSRPVAGGTEWPQGRGVQLRRRQSSSRLLGRRKARGSLRFGRLFLARCLAFCLALCPFMWGCAPALRFPPRSPSRFSPSASCGRSGARRSSKTTSCRPRGRPANRWQRASSSPCPR